MLAPITDDTWASSLPAHCTITAIGTSAEGRPLRGVTCGPATLPLVSIVAGAHPDEPAGPVAALQLLHTWHHHPLATSVRLAVVPVMDVDGIQAQRHWLTPWNGAVDLERYLQHRLRRLPGEDREFAWPGAPWGGTVLPECAAAAHFLDAQGPAIAHLSLHGMFAARGPWYLLDRLALRDHQLWQDLRTIASNHHLPLHEFFRHGDKGFRRCGRGFCTTPSGPAMRRHFLSLDDSATANGFGFGSMDAAQARARCYGAPPPLIGISEFPLLLLPDADPAAMAQSRQTITTLVASGDYHQAAAQYHQAGCIPLSLDTQVAGMQAMTEAVIRAALRRHHS